MLALLAGWCNFSFFFELIATFYFILFWYMLSFFKKIVLY